MNYNLEWSRSNKEYFKEYYSKPENRKRSTQSKLAWAKANPEKVIAARKKYKRNNKEKIYADNELRRYRRMKNFVEDVNRETLLARDNGVCHICGESVDDKWDIDHIIPLSREGEHSYANTSVSHPLCNQRKNDRLMEEL